MNNTGINMKTDDPVVLGNETELPIQGAENQYDVIDDKCVKLSLMDNGRTHPIPAMQDMNITISLFRPTKDYTKTCINFPLLFNIYITAFTSSFKCLNS
jgi:hypothetical protein